MISTGMPPVTDVLFSVRVKRSPALLLTTVLTEGNAFGSERRAEIKAVVLSIRVIEDTNRVVTSAMA